MVQALSSHFCLDLLTWCLDRALLCRSLCSRFTSHATTRGWSGVTVNTRYLAEKQTLINRWNWRMCSSEGTPSVRLRALMLFSNPCVYFELGVTDWQWNNTVAQKGNAVVISSDPKALHWWDYCGKMWTELYSSNNQGWGLMYEACLHTKKLRQYLFTQTTGRGKVCISMQTSELAYGLLSFCQLAAHRGNATQQH